MPDCYQYYIADAIGAVPATEWLSVYSTAETIVGKIDLLLHP
ncbi:hypothetical protein SAMN04487996_1197 [Dyadobacter soli]|uniref:Uncharacterized protein n=1 Tax=Dyadobacter soli TaxID=659014 RepID=A0A1G7UIM4_9BACT|nr:hypothetical protein SAMN04487996_1197 [Dyadobacter soli]